MLFDIFDWNIRGADLLCDSAGLTVLDVSATQFVQDLGFARIDVTQNADDGRPEFVNGSLLLRSMTTFLEMSESILIKNNCFIKLF